jgi:hypothetical protein
MVPDVSLKIVFGDERISRIVHLSEKLTIRGEAENLIAE